MTTKKIPRIVMLLIVPQEPIRWLTDAIMREYPITLVPNVIVHDALLPVFTQLEVPYRCEEYSYGESSEHSPVVQLSLLLCYQVLLRSFARFLFLFWR